MRPADVRIVFMGSPEFAVPSLRALAAAGYTIVEVVSQPDRPAGRGGRMSPPPVKAAAAELGIPVFQPETLKDETVRAHLDGAGADVLVVAAYGKILPRAVLAMPRRGSLNVHASLLPRWRGASPITAAILAGDTETGVSIMEVAPKMDAGPVVATVATAIGARETAGGLEERLAALGARALVEALPHWYTGELTPRAQDEPLATYCPLLQKSDGHLRAAMTAAEAERAVRAYNPWPGAFALYRGERLAVWQASVMRDGEDLPAGSLVVQARVPAIAFAGGLLRLEVVQRPGARRISGTDFVNGERAGLPPAVELA